MIPATVPGQSFPGPRLSITRPATSSQAHPAPPCALFSAFAASLAAGACGRLRQARSNGKVVRWASMRYFRFHSDLPHPVPAKRPESQRPGSGWPEQCPPMQAAAAFGWDVINPFEIRFDPAEESWELHDSVEVGGGNLEERGNVAAFDQDNCWQWDPNQVLPHRISPHVYPEIRNQAKVSTYLYLQTPPGWAILMSDIPNSRRRFRILSALLDTDWYYPAHPWHAVVELPRLPEAEPIVIAAGEPLCRLTPVRRASYSAAEMRPDQACKSPGYREPEFKQLYNQGQAWLEDNGRECEDPEAPSGALDIRGCYARQQRKFEFTVNPWRTA